MMRRRINRKHVIPSCLQCISRSRSARKDPRRVPSTFALHSWQSRGIPRIDPISSLADRKSRKRSTSRAACRPATRRFASFQSSLATTCLLLLLLLTSMIDQNLCSSSHSHQVLPPPLLLLLLLQPRRVLLYLSERSPKASVRV